MTAIDFPNEPEINDLFTVGDQSWRWTGVYWQLVSQVSLQSVPAGGTTGQVLSKTSDTDYDTDWTDAAGSLQNLDDVFIDPLMLSTDQTLVYNSAGPYWTNAALSYNALTNKPITFFAPIPGQTLTYDEASGTFVNSTPAWNYKGDYNNGYDYQIGDLVTFAGAVWYRSGEPNVGYAPGIGSAYWTPVTSPLPLGGAAGQVLAKNSTTEYDTSWVDLDALPDQTGNGGKYLTTDGSTASWANLVVGNIDGGEPTSVYGGIPALDGGLVDSF